MIVPLWFFIWVYVIGVAATLGYAAQELRKWALPVALTYPVSIPAILVWVVVAAVAERWLPKFRWRLVQNYAMIDGRFWGLSLKNGAKYGAWTLRKVGKRLDHPAGVFTCIVTRAWLIGRFVPFDGSSETN